MTESGPMCRDGSAATLNRMIVDVMAAEWLKLRTLRSSRVILGALVCTLVLAALISFQAVTLWDRVNATDRAHVAFTALEPLTGQLAALCLGILGVLTITTEYGGGMIHATLLAVPDRGTLLLGKAAVVALSAAVSGAVVVVGTTLVSQAVVGDRRIPHFTGAVAHRPAVLAGFVAVVTLGALLGLAAGTLSRSTVAGVVVIVLAFFVAPMLAQFLPGPLHRWAESLLPDSLPGQLAGVGNPDSVYRDALSPAGAAAVAVAYALLPLLMAVVVIRRRDA